MDREKVTFLHGQLLELIYCSLGKSRVIKEKINLIEFSSKKSKHNKGLKAASKDNLSIGRLSQI